MRDARLKCMRLSHPLHSLAPERRGFGARHAAMIALLIGVAVLLRADTAMPVNVRVPGLLILMGFLVYLLVGSFRTRSERRG